MSCEPFLSGALWNLGHSNFLPDEFNYRLALEEWSTQFDYMQDIGFNILFIFNGVNECMMRDSAAGPDLLEFLFAECDRRRMKVIISTGGNNNWWKYADLDRELNCIKATIEKIHIRYGMHPSFSGWYIPYEIFMPCGACSVVRDIYRCAIELCKAKTPHLPVVVSPFFMPDTREKVMDFTYYEPAEYTDAWSELLSYAAIDVLALQDNGGQHLSCFTDCDNLPFVKAFAQACKNGGTRFWGNVETGEIKTESPERLAAKYGPRVNVNSPCCRQEWGPVAGERLIEKLKLISEYSELNLSWGYREFYRPDQGFEGAKAYAAYRKYYQTFRSLN